jgi:hypothetical protein
MATSRRRATGRKSARRYHAARKLIIKGPELIPTAGVEAARRDAIAADQESIHPALEAGQGLQAH